MLLKLHHMIFSRDDFKQGGEGWQVVLHQGNFWAGTFILIWAPKKCEYDSTQKSKFLKF